MALPTTGISTSLVKATIGAATNDVGSLCSHPNINMWSKHKPVQFPAARGLSEAEFISDNNNWGILFQESSPHNGAGYYLNVYQKPTGGASSPYRLGDFRGYNHAAFPELYIKGIPSEVNKFTNQSISMDFNNTINVEIALTDTWFTPDTEILVEGVPIQHVDELIIGCEVRSGSTLVKEVFGTQNISTTKAFSIPLDDLAVGVYELAFFLFPPTYPSKRFPFPHTPIYPNHKNIQITYSIPFNLSALRYTVIDASSISQTVSTGTTNNVPAFTKVSIRFILTSTENITLKKSMFDLSIQSDIFETIGSTTLSVITKSAEVTETTTELIIPSGKYATISLERNTQYISNGNLHVDPYPVTYKAHYGAFLINQESFTFKNII